MNIKQLVISYTKEDVPKEKIRRKIEEYLLSNECSLDDMASAFNSRLVYKYIDIELYSKCIDKLTVDKSCNKILDSFVSFTRHLLVVINSNKVHAFIISLIIDANGFKRELGRHLWDELHLTDSNIDLLELSEEVQGKFALSILQDFNNPELRLPKLMTLFNCESEIVRLLVYQSLTNTTYSYVLNYFNAVKRYYETTAIKQSKESKMFEDCLCKLGKRFEMAYNCKELHPDYAMPEIFEYCNKTAQEHFKEQIKAYENKRNDSFFKLFPKVALGKGGWRKKNGDVQHLGHFKFSTEIPSMINALSYTEQIKIIENMYANWNTIANNNEEKID